jgi:hypothetical protein
MSGRLALVSDKMTSCASAQLLLLLQAVLTWRPHHSSASADGQALSAASARRPCARRAACQRARRAPEPACTPQVIDVERYEVVLVSPRNHFMCAAPACRSARAVHAQAVLSGNQLLTFIDYPRRFALRRPAPALGCLEDACAP